jgi:hypothetical protein
MVPSLTGSEADKRRAKRHQVRVAGRYLLADRTEWDCQTVDMSPTGVLLRGLARPYHGQIVVVYLAGLGRIEGTVVRLKVDEFALRIQATDRKREQLAAWLEGLANGENAPRRIDPAVLERAAEQAAERARMQAQAPPVAPAPSQPAVHPAVGYRIYLDSL